jgi:outer membrane protein OmpA-like peptidoglycan-associated protein
MKIKSLGTCLGISVGILSAFNLLAQNLVKNPEMKEGAIMATDFNKISLASGWSSATSGTVDLFSKSASKDKNGIPENRQGIQEAPGSNNYAGLIPFWEPKEKAGYTEYLQAELSTTLEAGKEYTVKFKVSLSEKSTRAVKGLAAHLSKSKVFMPHKTYLTKTPQVKSLDFVTDTEKWTEISGKIKAEGGEQYVVIGLFANSFPNEPFFQSVGKELDYKENRAYYFVTDVIVEEFKELDTDKDGIVDSKDTCPTVAGIASFAGCPDTDGDGVKDSEDVCPKVAGLTAFAGCPDTDGDGVPDTKDKCPTVAGVAEDKGCPKVDEAIMKKAEKSAKGVYFETAKDVIKKESIDDMDVLASILKADESLDCIIEGHTDNAGKPENNLVLSQKRADACKVYLVNKGIAYERLTAKGFGDTVPVDDNKTTVGKAKNRRVEFKLIH